MDNHLNRPEIQLALNNQLGHATRYSTTLEKTMMYLALPLSELSEDVFIRVSVPLTSIKEKSVLLFKRIFLVLVLATFF